MTDVLINDEGWVFYNAYVYQIITLHLEYLAILLIKSHKADKKKKKCHRGIAIQNLKLKWKDSKFILLKANK